jgi:hypothetical protein
MLTEIVAYLDSQDFDFAPFADANGNIEAIGIIHSATASRRATASTPSTRTRCT